MSRAENRLLAALPPLAKSGGLRHSLIAGVKTFESSQNGLSIKIRTQGKFELTDDWTGIARLAPWAEMRFEQNDGRTKRHWCSSGGTRPYKASRGEASQLPPRL